MMRARSRAIRIELHRNQEETVLSNLIAIAYDDVQTAREVTGTLGELAKEHNLELEDCVIVERKAGGKVKLHQPSLTGLSAANGALWGGLIGLIFLVPLFGMALGAASGAAAGSAADAGVDDDFMKNLGNTLNDGSAAVVVLVRSATRDKVLPEIQRYGGTVIQTSLSSEDEAALQDVLSGKPLPA
jgi:uncharacterized membrane protein